MKFKSLLDIFLVLSGAILFMGLGIRNIVIGEKILLGCGMLTASLIGLIVFFKSTVRRNVKTGKISIQDTLKAHDEFVRKTTKSNYSYHFSWKLVFVSTLFICVGIGLLVLHPMRGMAIPFGDKYYFFPYAPIMVGLGLSWFIQLLIRFIKNRK